MTSILFVDSHSIVGKNVYKKYDRKSEFCGVMLHSCHSFCSPRVVWICWPLYCSVRLTARVQWDWGGLASGPRYSLRTWTGDTFSHHLVTTFFASCSWHFRSPRRPGKSSDLTTKLASRQHWGEFPWKAATLTARWPSMLWPTRKEEGNFFITVTFYLQKHDCAFQNIDLLPSNYEILCQNSDFRVMTFSGNILTNKVIFWRKSIRLWWRFLSFSNSGRNGPSLKFAKKCHWNRCTEKKKMTFDVLNVSKGCLRGSR